MSAYTYQKRLTIEHTPSVFCTWLEKKLILDAWFCLVNPFQTSNNRKNCIGGL